MCWSPTWICIPQSVDSAVVSDRLISNQPSLYSTQPFVFGGTSRLAMSRTCRTGSGIIQIGAKMCTLLTPSLTGVHEPVPSSPLDRASLQIHLTRPTGGRSLLLTRSNVAVCAHFHRPCTSYNSQERFCYNEDLRFLGSQ